MYFIHLGTSVYFPPLNPSLLELCKSPPPCIHMEIHFILFGHHCADCSCRPSSNPSHLAHTCFSSHSESRTQIPGPSPGSTKCCRGTWPWRQARGSWGASTGGDGCRSVGPGRRGTERGKGRNGGPRDRLPFSVSTNGALTSFQPEHAGDPAAGDAILLLDQRQVDGVGYGLCHQGFPGAKRRQAKGRHPGR